MNTKRIMNCLLRYVVLFISYEMLMTLKRVYYLELVKRIIRTGKIKLYVVNNHIKIKNLPKRWLA